MDSRDISCKNKSKIVIPKTSFSVKVTNFKNPYCIRIYKTEDYINKSQLICKKLVNHMKMENLNSKDNGDPNLGDLVVVHGKASPDVDLPGWFCRGLIGHFDPMTMRYNVFLVDYGISVTMLKDDFIFLHDNICDEYLTMDIGIYNIIPTVIKKRKSTNELIQFITDKWTTKTIKFCKELIIASSKIYFDILVRDECGKYYGELYLLVNHEIICLSKTLSENGYATYLKEDLLKLIEEPNSEFEKECEDNVTTYFIKKVNESNFSEKQDVINLNISRTIQKGSECKERLHEKCSNAITGNDIHKVLIYSNISCKKLDFVSDAQFPAKIHMAWNSLLQSSKPNKMQSYIWPAIKQKLNVVAIGPKGSGKTVGYTFAITGLLAARNALPQGNSPSVLILCASSSEVFSVHSLCLKFLQGYGHIKSVTAFIGKSDRSLAAEIYNGCQILVSTPTFLVKFLRTYKNLLNFNSLCHLIFDNVDMILDKYYSSILELLDKHKLITNRENQSDELFPLQIIFTARHFTRPMRTLIRKVVYNPYICITSFLEAVIFKSVQPKLYMLNSKLKLQKLLDILGNECTLKTMIVCRTVDEAKEVNAFLSKHKQILLAHEEKHLFEIEDIKKLWQMSVPGFYPIIISTDEVLTDLNITDVDWLIHYSVSLEVKTNFNFRFSTLINNLQKEITKCEVTIFINENDNIQFLSIINTMKRMGVVLSNDMLLNIERISIALDKCKKEYPICDKVKSLGFCPDKSICAFRHCIISDVDAPITKIETGDKVKFMITYIHDASHFSGRIISYVKANNSEIIEFSKNEYILLTSKIQIFLGNINNRRSNIIEVGGIYGLEDSIESFKRVQVLQIKTVKKNRLETVQIADVRCIDTGNILTDIKVQKLLSLPEELSKLPTHIVEIFLVGVAPCDNEYEWNKYANEIVSDWFDKNYNQYSYIVGKVSLHLGNTIWTDTLNIGNKMIGRPDIVGLNLKTELINKSHAVVNKDHMQNIYTLCKNGGLIINNQCDIEHLKVS
ncbi:PREDICTED: putative ATP-dependent RNA helicase TDRD12 isoform X2 [Polistes canadensis]|uniref:putative ATP-dependent RNA helicase TDRD12 isoform X2 n=1 Tax=Polistes canadensis TaxID=91411 RepID=UPI000718DFF5|nr:PREDICTED: putative ATP-dependent RNA helicase TDRD12 isoform X2 [Polistes canadensis]